MVFGMIEADCGLILQAALQRHGARAGDLLDPEALQHAEDGLDLPNVAGGLDGQLV